MGFFIPKNPKVEHNKYHGSTLLGVRPIVPWGLEGGYFEVQLLEGFLKVLGSENRWNAVMSVDLFLSNLVLQLLDGGGDDDDGGGGGGGVE